MGDNNTEFDLIVVGYGLAGEAAASLAARLGHRVLVLERWPSLYGLPRTVSFDGEGARIVDKAGDIDHALKESSKIRSFQFVDNNGKLINQRTWQPDEFISGFYNRTSFYQPYVEEAMDRGAREHGADVRQGWEVTEVVPHADSVKVTAQQHPAPDEGEREVRTFTAKYVIGADGARSSVRGAIDTEWKYFDYRDAWLSVDVTRKVPLERFDPSVSTLVIAPERVIAVVPIGTERIRFEFLLGGEPEDHQDLSREAGYRFLSEAFDVSADEVEIYRQVVYPFEGRMVSRWNEGRVFLAGDAAHLMPPFVGMGAVSAFRDAINLVWKLDLVLRGVADSRLLDTYQIEREPHTREYINVGVGLGQMCTISDPAAAAARDEAIRAGGEEQPPDPEYDLGVLQMGEDGAVRRPAGLVEPQGVIAKGERVGRTDDATGHWGFSLVVRDADVEALLSDAQRAALEDIGCAVVRLTRQGTEGAWQEQDDQYEKFFAEHGVIGYLSRPDFRLFAGIRQADEVPAIVDDLLAQLSYASVRANA